MGYRIEYDTGAGKFEVRRESAFRFPLLLTAAVLSFLLLTLCFWPRGARKLRSVLIPGEDVVTAAAFRNLADDLRCGAELDEAFTAFCDYVIHGQADSD